MYGIFLITITYLLSLLTVATFYHISIEYILLVLKVIIFCYICQLYIHSNLFLVESIIWKFPKNETLLKSKKTYVILRWSTYFLREKTCIFSICFLQGNIYLYNFVYESYISKQDVGSTSYKAILFESLLLVCVWCFRLYIF